MRKRARRKKPKRPRRKDEASLYFLIERDLDRETVFRKHDGWYAQIGAGNARIDYAIRYDDLVLGVEVKSGFPKRNHFREVIDKYRNSFDALYLAYPSDRAAEAFSVSGGRSGEFSEIGIVSIALYRTHSIRRSLVIGRESDDAWDVFDEDVYRDEITSYITKNKVKIVDSILSDEGHIRLTDRDWRSLAVLYGMYRATSVDRFHSVDNLWKKHRKDLGWKGNVDYSNLLDAGLVCGRFYGEMLGLFSLSNEAYYREKRLRRLLRQRLGDREWNRLNEQSKAWAREHRRQQKDFKIEILVSPQAHTRLDEI